MTGESGQPGSKDAVFAALRLGQLDRPLIAAQIGGCNLMQFLINLPGLAPGPVVFRSTTASLVAPKISTRQFNFSACPLKSKFMLGDFRKDFRASLLESDWDFVVIDFFRDILTGSVRTGDSCVTELNAYVEGEPVEMADIFRQEFDVVHWRHPEFFDHWSAAATRLFQDILSPMMDQGRRVVMMQIYPTRVHFDELGSSEDAQMMAEHEEIRRLLERMHAFAEKLDPRALQIVIEDEYAIGAYDADYGAHWGHKINAYYARGAQLIGAALGIPAQETQTVINQAHLAETHARYERSFAYRKQVQEQEAAAAAELQAARDETALALARLAETTTLERERDSLTERLAAREQDFQAAKDRMAALHAEIAAMETDRQHLISLVSAERHAQESAALRSAGLQRELIELDRARAELAAMLGDERASHEARLEEYSAQARALSRQAATMRDEHLAAQAAAKAQHDAAMSTLDQRLAAALAAIHDLQRNVAIIDDERQTLQQRINALLASSSWRVTAPMRAAKSAWLRLSRRAPT